MNNQNKNGLITLGISIILLIIIYVWLGRPLIASSISIYEQNKDKKVQLEAIKKESDEVSNLEKEMTNLKDTMNKIENYLPQKADTSDLVVALEGATQASGNTITTVDFKIKQQEEAGQSSTEQGAGQTSSQTAQQPAGQTGGQPTTAPQLPQIAGTTNQDLEVTITGNFGSLINFLQKIENFPQFVNIASVDITGNAGSLEIKLDIYAYYRGNQS